MKNEYLVTFVLQGGVTQKMILDQDQKLFVHDLMHDLSALSFKISKL